MRLVIRRLLSTRSHSSMHAYSQSLSSTVKRLNVRMLPSLTLTTTTTNIQRNTTDTNYDTKKENIRRDMRGALATLHTASISIEMQRDGMKSTSASIMQPLKHAHVLLHTMYTCSRQPKYQLSNFIFLALTTTSNLGSLTFRP